MRGCASYVNVASVIGVSSLKGGYVNDLVIPRLIMHSIDYQEVYRMATNDSPSRAARISTSLRRGFFSSGMFLRILFALVVSIVIVMAFFATAAMSH